MSVNTVMLPSRFSPSPRLRLLGRPLVLAFFGLHVMDDRKQTRIFRRLVAGNVPVLVHSQMYSYHHSVVRGLCAPVETVEEARALQTSGGATERDILVVPRGMLAMQLAFYPSRIVFGAPYQNLGSSVLQPYSPTVDHVFAGGDGRAELFGRHEFRDPPRQESSGYVTLRLKGEPLCLRLSGETVPRSGGVEYVCEWPELFHYVQGIKSVRFSVVSSTDPWELSSEVVEEFFPEMVVPSGVLQFCRLADSTDTLEESAEKLLNQWRASSAANPEQLLLCEYVFSEDSPGASLGLPSVPVRDAS